MGYQKLTEPDIENGASLGPAAKGGSISITKGFLATLLTANTCCSAFAGMLLVIMLQVNGFAPRTSEFQPRLDPPSPPPPLPRISSSCQIYHASAAVLEGVMHTMTADGLKEVEAEEEEIATEGDGASLGFSNAFAPTFFDFECLLANGTGDPCDAYVAEAFADQMFAPLRVDSLVRLWLSTIFLYSLAQIGGIPRPRFIDRRIDWTGTVFWLSWIVTQLCQFFVVGISLGMQIVAFFGVYERTAPCMVRVDNSTLLDEFAMVTFAAQPALLSKLILLVIYGYLLSLGGLVFIGRNMNEVDFKEEASKTKTSLVQPIPIASVLYFISRWALYGICLGTVGGWLGGPVAAWAAALVAAAVGSFTGGFRRGNASLSRATIAKITLGGLLALPILPNLVYLPLGVLFFAFAKLSFAAGRRSLDLIASTDEMNWTRCKRVEALTKTAAAATKPAISWLAPLGSLKLSSSMSMVVQGLAYTETSLSTLAGGMACVLGCLALSPLVAYGTWAADQGRLEPDYDVEDSVVEAVQARLWMLWLLVAMPVVLFAVDRLRGKLLVERCDEGGIYLPLTSDARRNVLLTIYVIPFLLALGIAILFTSQNDSYIEGIIWHAQICYADSFAFLAKLQLDVSGLQPFLDSVMADMVAFTGDPLGATQEVVARLAEIAADPLAPVREVVEAVANMSRYLEIDASYFVEHSAALDILNIALGLLKLLATYGRKAFALYDVVLGLFSGEKEEGDEEDDGVVQVHECVADPKMAQVEADVELLLQQRGDYSDDKSSLKLTKATIADRVGPGDAATIALWLKANKVLTKLVLQSNYIGDEGAAALASALRVNGVLTNLNLCDNNIRDEGAAAIAEALRGNAVLKSLDLYGNNIRAEGAAAIAEALRGNGVLKNLDLGVNEIGDEGAKAIGGALAVNGVLTNLNLSDNIIGDEGAKALASALRVNAVLTNLVLTSNHIGEEGAKALASALRVNGVLKVLYIGDNELGDEGAEAIRDAVSGREGVLTNLDLFRNNIGDEGAKAIGGALAVNGVLTSLNVGENKIGPTGATAIGLLGKNFAKLPGTTLGDF
ncbi:hypothetical protein EMIHUDRAFT_98740 [Emiliania huxleyi CCMP1516]|uniref:Uncharacterized protein n=2 Tax=Emiliania huxleyi TaxID=2903 RepID=A0A0D3KF13_EMIH1|nr:hypothetical protein EMIHUDRAFT_98740 [Emiliania huxleyi CCMP1516]EOD34348.1 hypothetical protein EMIHUDRAFT_98740 [Emiliania huxleyi CCMP1516]|eukprot:XP_005786777.1 hypothetical protein EMIHUDRAFT_98740 [Emiliania huxleyi CCMP1516]